MLFIQSGGLSGTRIMAILLLLQMVTSSFQCSNCRQKDIYIDNSKSWLPLRGTSQLAFLDDAGNTHYFTARGLDTTVVNTTDCGTFYKYQYITNVLYLGNADSIYFLLFNKANLEARATNDNKYSFSMFAIFQKAQEGVEAKNLLLFNVGSRTYKQGIIIFRSQYAQGNIDSVILANNAGIVGFKYFDKRYMLK
jgi:hypothetical protein